MKYTPAQSSHFQQATTLRRMLDAVLQKCLRPAVIFSMAKFLGGGTVIFLDRITDAFLKDGRSVIVLEPVAGRVCFRVKLADFSVEFLVTSIKFAVELLAGRIDEIVINSLFFWNACFKTHEINVPDLGAVMNAAVDLKLRSKAPATYYFHDYFAVCPWTALTRENGFYCGASPQNLDMCRRCLKIDRPEVTPYPGPELRIEQWRQLWARFFDFCDRLVFFSETSRALTANLLPELRRNEEKIVVRPHEPLEMFPDIKPTAGKKIVIGCLNSAYRIKGSDVIAYLAQFVEQKHLPAEIRVTGKSDPKGKMPDCLHLDGFIAHHELPDYCRRNGVNIGFMSSICPETFSFVTQELMMMNIPTVYFNLGAQGERLSRWPRAMSIPDPEPQTVWNTIVSLYRKIYGCLPDASACD